jgi:hypothetical protein
MRGLEKNILVVSYVEPNSNSPVDSPPIPTKSSYSSPYAFPSSSGYMANGAEASGSNIPLYSGMSHIGSMGDQHSPAPLQQLDSFTTVFSSPPSTPLAVVSDMPPYDASSSSSSSSGSSAESSPLGPADSSPPSASHLRNNDENISDEHNHEAAVTEPHVPVEIEYHASEAPTETPPETVNSNPDVETPPGPDAVPEPEVNEDQFGSSEKRIKVDHEVDDSSERKESTAPEAPTDAVVESKQPDVEQESEKEIVPSPVDAPKVEGSKVDPDQPAAAEVAVEVAVAPSNTEPVVEAILTPLVPSETMETNGEAGNALSETLVAGTEEAAEAMAEGGVDAQMSEDSEPMEED